METLIPSFEEIQLPQDAQQQKAKVDEKPKKKTRYWLNVGIVRGEKLITLPMGIPLDDLKAKNIPSASSKATSEFRALRATEAKFWEQFQTYFHGLKPGESARLNFVCEVRMTEDKELTIEEQSENPFELGELKFT